MLVLFCLNECYVTIKTRNVSQSSGCVGGGWLQPGVQGY